MSTPGRNARTLRACDTRRATDVSGVKTGAKVRVHEDGHTSTGSTGRQVIEALPCLLIRFEQGLQPRSWFTRDDFDPPAWWHQEMVRKPRAMAWIVVGERHFVQRDDLQTSPGERVTSCGTGRGVPRIIRPRRECHACDAAPCPLARVKRRHRVGSGQLEGGVAQGGGGPSNLARLNARI